MKRPVRGVDGKYTIHGKTYASLIGKRAQVYHGTAYKTSGGLLKPSLLQNGRGRIVSAKKFHSATKEKRLLKYGYGSKKGKFGFVRVSSRKKHGRAGVKSRKNNISSR